MNFWFIAWMIIMVMQMGYVMAKHGEEREDHFNFPVSMTVGLIEIFIIYNAIVTGF